MYTVVQGEKIGRKMGFPTINLQPAKLEVGFGVYTCKVFLEKWGNLQGILHYGKRETTDGKITLEVHILDFNAEIYGKKIELKVKEKIRENLKFENLEELKKQITMDIKQAQSLIKNKEASRSSA